MILPLSFNNVMYNVIYKGQGKLTWAKQRALLVTAVAQMEFEG